ncbi:MAG: hypothetical protein LBP56_10765 [Odoribacteraceae bacterium]|jgi:outer membrane biosynthesis protein TonB|nr:hypothetical protein [Odoribacteraceae bacterium]
MKQSHNDIKKYLRGNRCGRHANALEKQSLSDPFLFEALEGLTRSPGDPLEGITRIERRLKTYTSSAIMHKKGWYGIAAGIVLIAGITWWSTIYREKREGMSLAQQADREEPLSVEPVIKAADELPADRGITNPPHEEHRASAVVSNESNTVTEKSEELTIPDRQQIQVEEQDEGARIQKAEPADTLPSRQERPATPIEGVSADSSGSPLVEEVAVAEESVAIHHANAPDTTSRDTADIVPTPSIQEETTRAIERDIFQFNQYVKEALRYPSSAVKNAEEGTIYLSFERLPDGSLANIRVISDFASKECTKELIRLLQTSPQWNHSPIRQTLYCVARFEMGQKGHPHRVSLSYIASAT